MSKRRLLALLGTGTLVVAAACLMGSGPAIFDKIADTVLANEVRFDDREFPRTAHAISASGDEVQVLGGQGHGLSCSLPLGAQELAFTRNAARQAPIALQMRQACAFHDYCYRHGNATYGYSQADCDFMLQQQAFRLCKYINANATVSDCETNARKVTIGVRIGGFGNFKRARALEDGKASTFMEFDPYPVRANIFRVVRVADAPRQWVRDGLLSKAAYYFDVRPSGSQVRVLGWKTTGEAVCSGFELPAAYNAINGPPMVIRDAPDGEDWFVWWKRSELSATPGYFALLPPGRAMRGDWAKVSGGFAFDPPHGECEPKALWEGNEVATDPAAFVTNKVNLEFSEVHPVKGSKSQGIVRLMGLSSSCTETDRSPCIVDVEFDTARKQFWQDQRPTRYRAIEPNCDTLADPRSRGSCDRYRNYVAAPFIAGETNPPVMIWMRRGTENGEGYEASATVRRYTVGKSRTDPAIDVGELTLPAFPESMEPFFVLNKDQGAPTFLSFTNDKGNLKGWAHLAVKDSGQPVSTEFECFRRLDASWLRRTPALVTDPKETGRRYIVFSRIRLNSINASEFLPTAKLEIAVASIVDSGCNGVRESAFPSLFDRFVAPEELRAGVAAADERTPLRAEQAEETFGRFAERVRGGQMVLADLTGDGVPDLLQVARLPATSSLRTALLVGEVDAAGLRFRNLAEGK